MNIVDMENLNKKDLLNQIAARESQMEARRRKLEKMEEDKKFALCCGETELEKAINDTMKRVNEDQRADHLEINQLEQMLLKANNANRLDQLKREYPSK